MIEWRSDPRNNNVEQACLSINNLPVELRVTHEDIKNGTTIRYGIFIPLKHSQLYCKIHSGFEFTSTQHAKVHCDLFCNLLKPAIAAMAEIEHAHAADTPWDPESDMDSPF